MSELPTPVEKPPQPGMRDRKKARTRRHLIDAALRLFATRGFDATTVQAIAAEADVHPRTFFRHFASKEDVVLTENRARLQRILDDLKARPDDVPVLTALREAHQANHHDYWRDPEGLRQQVELTLREPALRARDLETALAWQQQVTAEIARRLGTDPARDLRAKMLAGSCMTVMSVCAETWITGPADTDVPDLVDQAFNWLEHGLA